MKVYINGGSDTNGTNGGVSYKGFWNANTNSPDIANLVSSTGDFYIVSVSGTQDLGNGATLFTEGQWVIYNGTSWDSISITSSAGGVDTQVQFNDGGLLAGATAVAYDKATGQTTFNSTKQTRFVEFNSTSKSFTDSGYNFSNQFAVVWNTSGGNCIQNLPTCVGKYYLVSIHHSELSTGNNTLTIVPFGTEKVGQETSQVIPKGSTALLFSTGSEWIFI